MGRYHNLAKANYNKLRNDESVMWGSIAIIDVLLEEMAEHHKERYWRVMRDTHELMYGKHFDKEYAEFEVEKMHHKCGDVTYKGEHWSIEQTNEVMNRYKGSLPNEVTPYDFYVALNSQWHDYHCIYKMLFSTEEDAENAIIESAIAFWFKDDDWGKPDKVWCYFNVKEK